MNEPQIIRFDSETKRNQRPLVNINGYLATRYGDESKASVRIPQGVALLRMTPGKMMEVNVEGQEFDHKSKIERNIQSQEIDVQSNTKISNRNVADVQGRFGPKKSNLKVQTSEGDVEYDYSKGDKAWVSFKNMNLEEKLDQYMRKLTKQMKNKCAYNSACHEIARSYESAGFKGAQEKIWSMAQKRYESVQDRLVNFWNKRLPAVGQKMKVKFEHVRTVISKTLDPSNFIQKAQILSDKTSTKFLYSFR